MSAPVRLDNVLKNLKENRVKKEEPPKEQQQSLDAAIEQPAPAEAPAPQELAPGEVPLDEKENAPQVPAVAAAAKPALSPVGIGRFGVELRDLNDLARFSKMVFESGLAPKGFNSPQGVAVAIQLGAEIGLSPMTAVQNIAVINGRPGVFGEIPLALAQASGELEVFEEWFEHKGKRVETWPTDADETTTAFCHAKRLRGLEKTISFSVSQAKKADLWGKAGPWTQYPFRMLMWRPRQFVLRDLFPDKLKGVRTTDELRDDAIDTELAEPGPIEMPRRASEMAAAEPQA